MRTVISSNGVALRKESVDRNLMALMINKGKWLVALRKESVDRNKTLYRARLGV